MNSPDREWFEDRRCRVWSGRSACDGAYHPKFYAPAAAGSSEFSRPAANAEHRTRP